MANAELLNSLELTPIWNADSGLCFQIKDKEWLGETTSTDMRFICDFLNNCLKAAQPKESEGNE
jgi:hypothetical protein